DATAGRIPQRQYFLPRAFRVQIDVSRQCSAVRAESEGQQPFVIGAIALHRLRSRFGRLRLRLFGVVPLKFELMKLSSRGDVPYSQQRSAKCRRRQQTGVVAKIGMAKIFARTQIGCADLSPCARVPLLEDSGTD